MAPDDWEKYPNGQPKVDDVLDFQFGTGPNMLVCRLETHRVADEAGAQGCDIAHQIGMNIAFAKQFARELEQAIARAETAKERMN